MARAENPKVQRPSEVSWSYLYLAPAMEARSNQTNAWTQVLAVDMDRVTTQHDGRASTRLSGIYVKNKMAGCHPYPVITCGISAGDIRFFQSYFLLPYFLLPASCLAFWAALLCLLFAQLSALCLLSPKEHFDKGTQKRENKGKNIKEKIIK